MKIPARTLLFGSFLVLSAAELIPSARIGVIRDAQAIIGAPATPMSVAGVARRSAFRTTEAVAVTAAASSAAAASAASAQKAAAPPPSAPAPVAAPAPAPSAGPPAVGTVVPALPAGCVSAPVSGIEYYLCGGVYYRAGFQGNNLVYVVAKP